METYQTDYGVWLWPWEEPKLFLVPPRVPRSRSSEDADRYRIDADGRPIPYGPVKVRTASKRPSPTKTAE